MSGGATRVRDTWVSGTAFVTRKTGSSTLNTHQTPQTLAVSPAFPGAVFGTRKFDLKQLTRITLDLAVMGGKVCIRGLRVTVGMIVGLLAAGRSREEILKAYPYLKPEDIDQTLAYAAWRVEKREVPLAVA